MYAVVLTGRMLPGCSPDEVWEAVAAKFNLGIDVLKSRVLHRAPVTIRELADFDQAQRMQAMLMHCGAEADLVPTDGVRWQLKDGNGQKGPVPREFLRVARARRMLASDALVRRSADAEWLPLESVGESVSSPADAGPVADARRGVLPPPLPESRPAMSNVGAASPERNMPPPLPLPHSTASSPEASDAKSKWGWVAGALVVLAFVVRMLRAYQSNGLGGVLSKLWPILLLVGALVVLIVMHERLMKNPTFSRWWSKVSAREPFASFVRALAPATSEKAGRVGSSTSSPGLSGTSAPASATTEEVVPPLPPQSARAVESFKSTNPKAGASKWPWVIAGMAALIACAWGLFGVLEKMARTGCGDAEAISLAESIIYKDVGKQIVLTMYGQIGQMGMATSQEDIATKTAKAFLSLDLTGVSTTGTNGAALECTAILAVKDPATAVNPELSAWQKSMVNGLNGHVVRYSVVDSDDFEHIVVTVHPIQ